MGAPRHKHKKHKAKKNRENAKRPTMSNGEVEVSEKLQTKEPNPGTQERGGYPHPPRKSGFWGGIKLTDVVVAAATVVIAVVGCLQFSIMNSTLNLERPWIGPTTREIDVNKITNRIDSARWHFENGGRSPATRVRARAAFKLGPANSLDLTEENRPQIDQCIVKDDGTAGFVVLPHVDQSLPVFPHQDVIDRMDDIYAGKVGLYLVGCVDYSDTSRKASYRTYITEHVVKDSHLFRSEVGNDAY
jgi:hypothetical protein